MKKLKFSLITLFMITMLIGSAVKQESNSVYMKDGKVDHERYELIMQKKIEALQDTLPERYTEEILFEAKWGDGADEYWYYGDSPVYGPGPIAIDNDGSIYVYDGSHGRVMKYTVKGIFEKSIEVNISNRFLSVIDGVIYGERYELDKKKNEIITIDVETGKEIKTEEKTSRVNSIENKLNSIKDVESEIRLENKKYSGIGIGYMKIGCDKEGNEYFRVQVRVNYYRDTLKSFYDKIDEGGKYSEIQKYSREGKLQALFSIGFSNYMGVGDNKINDLEGNVYYLFPEVERIPDQFGYKIYPKHIRMFKYSLIK